MATNVPPPTLTSAGFAVPDEADILAGVFADLQAAFGGGLNPGLYTPQGQMASSLAAMIGSNNDQFLLLTNQVDPANSTGRFQDAIGRIYFLERKPPLPTTVTATLIGSPGITIPAGSLAQATDGTIYQSLGTVSILGGGTVTVAFQSLTTGPIDCPAGTLRRIYRAIPGWDAVTNVADGVPGRDEESRADFEQRRADSVATNAAGVLPAVRGVVLSVPGVIDAYVTENNANAARAIGGVTLPAHSLYVAVLGGSDADVARAIWSKKNPGCDYAGNVTVTVQDTTSGYSIPYPEYDVTFQRVSTVRVYATVQIATSSGVPADATEQIRAAIARVLRQRIGATLFASAFYCEIAALGPWARIVAVNVGTTSGPVGDRVSVNIDQVAGINAADISVELV